MTDTVSTDDKSWATLCHISSLAGWAVPFGHILAPLVLWLIKRDGRPLVDDQGKEAVNFQISFTLYMALVLAPAALLVFLQGPPRHFSFMPFAILAAVFLFAGLALVVIGAVRAYHGEPYRYPFTLRLIR
ncbi:MAG TPA: DUF4870 domain-containing protein [Thermoanaerobaculia bacterium]|nr:DUF4870 domain-containing protein [Thermoanaerobaculia bacterium]